MVLTQSVKEMAETQPGVYPEHSRTGIAHYRLNFLPPLALIAMYRAVGTGRFFLTEATMLQAQGYITRQVLTIGA